MSGSIRSRIAASGGFTAARSSASSAGSRVTASKPASRRITFSARRICGSSSQTRMRGAVAHPAATARHRGRGEADDEAAALPGQRLDLDLAAVGLDEALGDRQAEAGAAAARCRRGRRARRSARARARGCRAPGRRRGPRRAAPTSRERTRTGWPLAVEDGVLEQVGEGALELGGVGARAAAARRRAPAAPARRGRRASRAPPPAAPARSTGSRRGSACPVSSRETSSRFSTRRESRWPCSTTASLSSWRSSALALGESSAAPAAMIEVSGVRRSWETERSSEVFSSSLRRSAPASIASACMRSRSRASAASSASSPVGLLAARARPRQRGRGPARPGRCWRRRRSRRRPARPVVVGGDVERARSAAGETS